MDKIIEAKGQFRAAATQRYLDSSLTSTTRSFVLPRELATMLVETYHLSFAELPVLSDDHFQRMQIAQRELELQDRQMADTAEIANHLGALALLYPVARMSDVEAEMRIRLFADLLGDLPRYALTAAFREAAKRCRFHPTVAEIREHAEPVLAERRATLNRIRRLISRSNPHV